MKPSNAKQKGKLLEDWVSDLIIKKGLDDRSRRDSASGASNRDKRDIVTSMQVNGRTAGIECKNHKALHIQEWWRQTCKLEKDYEPILIFKLPYKSLDESLAVIRVETLLDLVKGQGEASMDENSCISYSDIYTLKNAKSQLAKAIKILENTL